MNGSESSGEPVRVEPTGVDEPDRPTARARQRFGTRSTWLYTAAGALGLLAVIYGADLVNSVDRVPRGTEVAGVSVGGMLYPSAEEKLRAELAPRLDSPVDIRAGAVSTTLDPDEVGLSVDWPATLQRGGSQPLNPFVRFISLFTSREVGIASLIPDERLTQYLEALSETADFAPREGAIWFDEAEVKSTTPMDGQELQIEDSRDQVLAHWLSPEGVDLAVEYTPTRTDAENVRAMVRDVAEPAVERELTLVASAPTDDGDEPPMTTMRLAPDPESNSERAREGRELELVDPRSEHALRIEFPRERIGEYLSFEIEDDLLVPRYDAEAARGILGPELEETEQEGRDATFDFSGGSPRVVPAVQGRTVDWDPLLEVLPDEMRDDRGPRLVPVSYESRDPELSTEDAEDAGITHPVGESTIPVPASSTAQAMISAIHGDFVGSGSSYSLRSEVGVYSGDRGADAVATALFNAAYEAGASSLVRSQRGTLDPAFPLAREATASSDVGFSNPQDTGLAIDASYSGNSVTVRLWGTREYDVSSSENPRSSVQPPSVRTVRTEDCEPDPGEEGFTATASRTVRAGNQVVRSDEFSSTYPAQDAIECGPPLPDDDEDDGPPPPPPPPGIDLPFPIPGFDIPGVPR